jgi:hypothetical protein
VFGQGQVALEPAQESAPEPAQRPRKTFSLHIGADLKLPTPNAERHSSYEAAPAAMPAAQAASDPFEGLPFRAMAERMGAAMSPVVQAVKEDARTKRLREAGLLGNQQAEVAVPSIPHFLPFTRWAAQSETMKSTFVVEGERKRARLSWYHPDDTMVPRGWWKLGLLEDLKYYKPFSTAS